MPKKTGASRRVSIAARQKEQDVVRLKLAGLTLGQIAERLGYKNESGPYKALQRHLRRNLDELSSGTEIIRQEELERLDWWLQNISGQIIAGDLGAVNTGLRIQERRAALMGLDAPKQFEARVRLDVVSWNQAIRDFLEVYREYHSGAAEAPGLMDRLDKLAEDRFAGVIQ